MKIFCLILLSLLWAAPALAGVAVDVTLPGASIYVAPPSYVAPYPCYAPPAVEFLPPSAFVYVAPPPRVYPLPSHRNAWYYVPHARVNVHVGRR
jgi:hypothetical protein